MENYSLSSANFAELLAEGASGNLCKVWIHKLCDVVSYDSVRMCVSGITYHNLNNAF